MNSFYKFFFVLSNSFFVCFFLPVHALLIVENPLKKGSFEKVHPYSESVKVLNVLSYLQEIPVLFFKPKKESEQSMLGFLKKSVQPLFSKKEIIKEKSNEENLLNIVKLFHINASDFSHKAELIKMMREVKSYNIKISLDLGSIENVKKYKDELLNILPKYVDILFANEKEILELTHLPASEACDFLSTFCEVVVVTLGYQGSWVKSGKMKFYTPSLKANQIENAKVGTLFIAGFLHGYLSEATLPNCSWIGSFIASKGLGMHDPGSNPIFLKQIKTELEKENNLIPNPEILPQLKLMGF